MMALAGTKLDRDVLIQFLKIISIYPTGASVTSVESGDRRRRWSASRIAEPSDRQNRKQDQMDRELDIKEIDLAKHTTVFIEQVL